MATPEVPDPAPDASDARCPYAGEWVWRNTVTGEVRPDRCRSSKRCAYCMSVNAWKRSRAIAYAVPERYVVLTQVGDEWPTRRSRIKDVTRDLRSLLGVNLQWAWTIEPNPEGTGHHLNAYQYGDFIPQAELSRIARRRGMGEVAWITRIKGSAENATSYGVKLAGAPSYGLKNAGEEAMAREYLEVNGGRLTHQTRGFWRHPDGTTIKRAREAEAAALRATFGDTEGEWVRERYARGNQVGPEHTGSLHRGGHGVHG